MTGNSRDFSHQMALHRSSQAGDFGPSIDHALELYREDTNPENPNRALKAFWPSTSSLRTTLYSAGKRLGPDANKLLERIDDSDLHLFAQIALAAALAGLPALPESSMRQRRPPPMQGTAMRAPDGSTIRCPKCSWVPVQDARWSCKCGHVWNTFEPAACVPSASTSGRSPCATDAMSGLGTQTGTRWNELEQGQSQSSNCIVPVFSKFTWPAASPP